MDRLSPRGAQRNEGFSARFGYRLFLRFLICFPPFERSDTRNLPSCKQCPPTPLGPKSTTFCFSLGSGHWPLSINAPRSPLFSCRSICQRGPFSRPSPDLWDSPGCFPQACVSPPLTRFPPISSVLNGGRSLLRLTVLCFEIFFVVLTPYPSPCSVLPFLMNNVLGSPPFFSPRSGHFDHLAPSSSKPHKGSFIPSCRTPPSWRLPIF